MKIRNIKLSKISTLHYIKLFYRSALFVVATVLYIINRVRHTGLMFSGYENDPIILTAIWLVFAVEMILRFLPSSYESMGCQKQFRINYIPTKEDTPHNQDWRITLLVFTIWIAFNSIFWILYLLGIIDHGILLLIALAYSVCDMICILFFCPFQTWFMRNKCCGACRIYNWDYAMMFTPLLFVPGIYTWSILALALGLFVSWEVLYHKHPERFAENTNAALHCANCQEKLCAHKKQLQAFQKRLMVELKEELRGLEHRVQHYRD
jgi:hypothetical protein